LPKVLETENFLDEGSDRYVDEMRQIAYEKNKYAQKIKYKKYDRYVVKDIEGFQVTQLPFIQFLKANILNLGFQKK